MHILVTGAAGRIGRVVVAALAQRHRVRLTDRLPGEAPPGCEMLCADLAADPLEGLCDGIDAVLHLAGNPNSRDWEAVGRANIDAARRLFEAAAAAGVRRIVYASSIHVAGFAPAASAFADEVPMRPDGPYGVSKAAAELVLRYLCDRDGISAVALRIGSFRSAPGNARELRTWISPGDMARLAEAALTADVAGFHGVWGLSANSRAVIAGEGRAAIGYAPQDDAEAYVPALEAAGVDTAIVSEWPCLGGAFAVR